MMLGPRLILTELSGGVIGANSLLMVGAVFTFPVSPLTATSPHKTMTILPLVVVMV